MTLKLPDRLLEPASPLVPFLGESVPVFLGKDKRSPSASEAILAREKPRDHTSGAFPFTFVRIPRGFVVFDLDDPALMDRLDPEHTLTVTTPHGFHFWYRTPLGLVLPRVIDVFGFPHRLSFSGEPHADTASRLGGRSLDVCSHDGFAVVPPSPGYVLTHATFPAMLPERLALLWYRIAVAVDDLEATAKAASDWRIKP